MPRLVVGLLSERLWRPGAATVATYWITGILLAGVFAVTWFIGIVPTRTHPYDSLYFAESGYRTLLGQRPHLDYYSPYGDSVQLLLAAGQWMAGGTLNGVGYMSACYGLIMGIWAYLLLRHRAPAPLTIAMAVYLMLLSVAPVSLGYSFANSSQAMFYNRFSFAILSLLILECFPLWGRHSRAGAISTGVICAVLLFMKGSYFMVAVSFAAVSLLWNDGFSFKRIAAILGGFVAASLPFALYLGFRLDLFLGDMALAGRARSAFLQPDKILELFKQESWHLMILVPVALTVGYHSRYRGTWRMWRMPILTVVLYCSSVLLTSTNAQIARLPLNEFWALVCAAALFEIATRAPDRITIAIMAVLSLGVAWPYVMTDVVALANGARLKQSYNTQYAHNIPIGRMTPWVMLDDYHGPEEKTDTGAAIVPYVTDGVNLLRQHMRPGETILTFDCYNPFPYLLGSTPPKGGMGSAVYPQVFNQVDHPPSSLFFRDVDLVMYPKKPAVTDFIFSALPAIYGEDLERQYTVVAESPLWKLYRRNG
jgi:hypothetical protein